MKKILLLSLLAVSSLTACKKDDDNDDKPKTKAELLVDKRWRLSAATVSATVNGKLETENLMPYIDDFDKDDFMTFKADKTFILDEGPTKEDSSDPQTISGTWDMNFDQTKLYLADSGSSADAVDLTEVTASKLVLSFVDSYASPAETYTFTYASF